MRRQLDDCAVGDVVPGRVVEVAGRRWDGQAREDRREPVVRGTDDGHVDDRRDGVGRDAAAPGDLDLGDRAGRRRTAAGVQAIDGRVGLAGVEDDHFSWRGPIGVTFPGVVRHGVIHSAANVDKSWIGTDADALFTKAAGGDVHVVNDADAAGLAEVRFGAGRDRRGS